MKFVPHNYQKRAMDFMKENERCCLFLDMGLGKTVTSLSCISEMLDLFEVGKTLVVAPKLVAEQTWPDEIAKWDHLTNISVSVIKGSPAQRLKALKKPADLYTIGRDNIKWLVDTLGRGGWDFDTLILDELSSFKNHASQRFRALRKVTPMCSRVVGLTGTPAPNSLLDLWSQLYLIDKGERLGKTLTQYREAYFRQNFNGFGYTLVDKYQEVIQNKIKDICISMTAEDYLDLPERMDVIDSFDMKSKERYDEFKRNEVLPLMDGETITPVNAAAMYSKLLQFANGAVYDEDKNYHVVDDTKIEKLKETIEALQGNPVLVFYQFQSDKDRILKAIPEAQIMQGAETVHEWNRGEIPVLIAHPASIGHGLNLQYGGHNMIWFGLPWSLEAYQQSVKRLDRQGQTNIVINKALIAKGTVEEVVWERLTKKADTQNELINALKDHVFA